jgi:hypothetical protein
MKMFVAFALAASTLTAPVLAAADTAPEASFTRDGQTYFVKETKMAGYTLIEGHDDKGRKFNFRLAGQRVTGHYDDQYMEFSAPAKADRLASN